MLEPPPPSHLVLEAPPAPLAVPVPSIGEQILAARPVRGLPPGSLVLVANLHEGALVPPSRDQSRAISAIGTRLGAGLIRFEPLPISLQTGLEPREAIARYGALSGAGAILLVETATTNDEVRNLLARWEGSLLGSYLLPTRRSATRSVALGALMTRDLSGVYGIIEGADEDKAALSWPEAFEGARLRAMEKLTERGASGRFLAQLDSLVRRALKDGQMRQSGGEGFSPARAGEFPYP